VNDALVRRGTLQLLGLALLLQIPICAHAEWPERPITLVVGNPPGGTNDIITRLYAPHISKDLGRPVIVDNKVGGGGSVATDAVARSQPNGYSFVMQASTVHAGLPLARKDLTWSPADLRSVAMAAQAWYVVTATTKVPARNLKEFIAHGKANPGKLNYATLGPGSLPHIGGVLFSRAAGLDLTAIPYQGSGPATVNLISGVVELFIVSTPPVAEHIKAGTLRGWGRIVNVASASGFRASLARTAYGTSKAAVIGLTRQMAVELAPLGITVNAIAPGPVDTPLARAFQSDEMRRALINAIPAGRYGTPEEMAGMVSFLASEDASFVTGHTFPVDGGFVAAGVLTT
jgi:hypothetical protein